MRFQYKYNMFSSALRWKVQWWFSFFSFCFFLFWSVYFSVSHFTQKTFKEKRSTIRIEYDWKGVGWSQAHYAYLFTHCILFHNIHFQEEIINQKETNVNVYITQSDNTHWPVLSICYSYIFYLLNQNSGLFVQQTECTDSSLSLQYVFPEWKQPLDTGCECHTFCCVHYLECFKIRHNYNNQLCWYELVLPLSSLSFPGISTLIAKGVYDAAFPLHDVSASFRISRRRLVASVYFTTVFNLRPVDQGWIFFFFGQIIYFPLKVNMEAVKSVCSH